MAVTVLSMSSPIEDFFRHPRLVVAIEPSDRLKALEDEVERLTIENNRLLSLYSQECGISMRAIDLLRAHGIKWR